MGLLNPDIGGIDGKFSEVVGENKPFVLNGAEVISGVKTQGYGEGEMVVLTVTLPGGERKRLGIWGAYLVEQARSADESDFGKVYVVRRGPVKGYSDRPDTKSLAPADNADDIPF